MSHPRSGHGADPGWTWAEEEYLRFLARRGYSPTVASERLGRRSRASVQLKAGRIGVTFAPRPGGAPLGNRNGEATWFRTK